VQTEGNRWNAQGAGRVFFLVLAIGAVALAVVACGSNSGGSGSQSSGSSSGSSSKKDYRIAIMSVGSENDRSWANANFDGAKAGAKKYGAKLTVVPNLGTPEQYLQQGAAFARRGFNMVLLQHGAMTQPAQQLAKQFPKTEFGIVWDPTAKEKASLPSNLFTWDPRQQDGGFLAGALAGLITKTNTVGGVSGAPFPLITRQLEAFDLGARCSNPGVKVLQRYTGDVTFADAKLAGSAATAVMGDGADVVFTALDGAANGVYQAARKKKGTYVIAQYFDQAQKAPDVILTSVLQNLQGINEDLVKRGVEGTIKPGEHFEYTLGNKDVGTLAPFGNLDSAVSAAQKAKLGAIEKKIRSGAIKVPANEALAKAKSAAKIDPKSLGC
jgi:basic membrane lipoprotein Med (substrate-binding protein (PBP1-ABC) superfamily)